MSGLREVSLQLPDDEMRIRFRSDETVVFASSSGHCNLDCAYCVASPVVKHQSSLTYDDLMFVADKVAGRVFFIFSGRGDFFAGYRKSDRLLERLLEHEQIAVALDINGVVIHCFPDLPAAKLARVRHVNLTMHYRELRQHKALGLWKANAIAMLSRHDSPDFFVNFILSSDERELWQEALDWYRHEVFGATGKPLVLINDVISGLSDTDHAELRRVSQRFDGMLQSVRIGNFETLLSAFDSVSCAAGVSYFRVWNDGTIDACPNRADMRNVGNAKQRTMTIARAPVPCSNAIHCDCYHVASAGKLRFYRGESMQERGVAKSRRVIAIAST